MSSNGQTERDTGHRRRYWKAHIESWSKSGLSQVDYCRVNNLVTHRFGYWKKRLKSTDGDVSFIPVQLAEQLPVAVAKRPFSLITPNGYRIEVNDGFDPATLHRLIGSEKSDPRLDRQLPIFEDEADPAVEQSATDTDTVTIAAHSRKKRGRKTAARPSAAFSMIETAKANGLEPYIYLRYLFDRLPHARDEKDLCTLLPQDIDQEAMRLHR